MQARILFAPEGEPVGGGAVPAVVAAPAVVPAPVAAAVVPPVAAVPVAATPPAAVDPATDPAWFKPRLEREAAAARTKLLGELGATDLAGAKAAIAAAKAAEDANKSAQQIATETGARNTALSAENERLAAITREHAGRMLGVLTTEQQAAVRALSPDTDPAGQLHAIGVLGPTWAAATAAVIAATAAATPAVVAPPAASTAPGATAPTGGAVTSPPDHKSVYAASRAKNPFAAAAYGLEHASEVYRPKA